jgi:hypothetical protein
MNVDNRMSEKSKKGGDMMTTPQEGHCNQCIMRPMGKVTVVRDFTDINGNTQLIGVCDWQLPNHPYFALCDEHMANYTAMKPFLVAWVE